MTREPAGRLAIDQSLQTELRGATVLSIGHSHSHRRTLKYTHTHAEPWKSQRVDPHQYPSVILQLMAKPTVSQCARRQTDGPIRFQLNGRNVCWPGE